MDRVGEGAASTQGVRDCCAGERDADAGSNILGRGCISWGEK